MKEFFQKFTGFFKPRFIFNEIIANPVDADDAKGDIQNETTTPEEAKQIEAEAKKEHDAKVEMAKAEGKTKLAALQSIVESARVEPDKKAVDQIPLLAPLIEKLAVTEHGEYEEIKEEIKDKFTDYVKELNDRYLPLKKQLEAMKKAGKNKEDMEEYEELTERYTDVRAEQISTYLEMVFNKTLKPDDLKKNLGALANGLESDYKEISGDDEIIDLNELRDIEADRGLEAEDLLYYLSTNQPEKVTKILENMGLMHPEAFSEVMERTATEMIREAEKSGTDDKLLTAAQKEWGSDIKDLNDIKIKMKEYGEAGQAGAAEALQIISRLESATMGNLDALFDNAPDSLKGYVIQMRSEIMRGKKRPTNLDDVALVRFIRLNSREAREKILANEDSRKDLFKAIANIKQYYPNEYAGKTPTIAEVNKSVQPYLKPIAAMAMVALAKEATTDIKNLNEELGTKLESHEADSVAPRTNFDFEPEFKTRRVGHVSKAIRDGMNGAAMGKMLLVGWSLFTGISNILAAKGDISLMMKNPYILGAGGLLYALTHPTLTKTLGKTPEVAEEMWVHEGLSKLNKRHEKQEINNFVGNPAEFTAMEELGAEQIKGLIEKARESTKGGKNKPEISAAIIKEALGDEAPEGLTESEDANRLRFDFYRNLYNKKRNMRQLQKHSKSWLK